MKSLEIPPQRTMTRPRQWGSKVGKDRDAVSCHSLQPPTAIAAEKVHKCGGSRSGGGVMKEVRAQAQRRQSEWRSSAKRSMWDSLLDGLMPRPFQFVSCSPPQRILFADQ
jgi:hypothetical protein